MREAIKSAVRGVEATSAFRFQLVAEVKEKAIQGAIQKYTVGCTVADVVALMDTTVFGSGKEGFLLAATRLYSSYFNQKNGVALQGLKSVEQDGTSYLIFGWQDGSTVRYYVSIYAAYVREVLLKIIEGIGPAEEAKAEEEVVPVVSSLEEAVARRLAQKKAAGAAHDEERTVDIGLEEAVARALSARGLEKDDGADAQEETAPEPKSDPVTLPEDPEAARQFSEGLREYRKGNYTGASRSFQKAANLEHPYAYFNLAVLYDLGRGVTRNLTTALRWYRKAAAAGIPEAQFNAAQMCYLGQGTDAAQEEAFAWYLKAAEAGIAGAQAMVGAVFADGIVTDRDPDQARSWMDKAASQGLEAAREALERL